jgi:alpha-methylacyl-CoA racemase
VNAAPNRGTGPLAGVRVVEFAGLGPTPFACMMLADLGADIVRLDRPGGPGMLAGAPALDTLNRGRASLEVDLKAPHAEDLILDLCRHADVVIEGYRPGVMERLGFGPDRLLTANPKLVFARMTGWGQEGPLASFAGHDINYIAMTGALHLIGPSDAPPPPPLNLIGDFGGGGMYAVTGILAALLERERSGLGQVIDIAMVDGVSSLLAQAHAWKSMGFWNDERSANLLDGAAYFYRCYETSDARFLAVGAIEKKFHDAFVEGLGLTVGDFSNHMDRRTWPERARLVAEAIGQSNLSHWMNLFEARDACVSPVLTLEEAAAHPFNRARNMFSDGAPNPAPRFSRSLTEAGCPSLAGEGAEALLARWGVSNA